MKKSARKKNNIFEKRVNRRDFLKTSVKLGMAGSLLGTGLMTSAPPAWAVKSLKGSGEMVICAWGGAFQDAMRETIFEPFTRHTGIKVIDTSIPSPSKIKAQVDSGNLEWDIAVVGKLSGLMLGGNYLEKIDYSYFNEEDYNNIPEAVRAAYSCAAYFFSMVIAYSKKVYPNGNHPKSWADFVNFEKFPGKRTFRTCSGSGYFHVEIGQLGMGVSRDKLFPADVDKAWAWFDKLKPQCIKWWKQGAEAPQMLVDGELPVAAAYSSRIQKLIDEGVPVGYEWNEGEMADDSYAVLKGAKNATNAMKFIAFACRPEIQAAFAEKYPYGPSNLLATELVKPETRKNLNTAPENFKKQFIIDWDWLAAKNLDPKGKLTNREYLANKWQAWILQ